MSYLAKNFLGIPITSDFIERSFSKTCFIMRPHRRCMGDDLAEILFYCCMTLEKLIVISVGIYCKHVLKKFYVFPEFKSLESREIAF